MRKLALVLLIAVSLLIGCSPRPSESDIQTAIAQTNTAKAADLETSITPEPPQHTDTPVSMATPQTDSGIVVDPGCSQFNAPGDDGKNKEEEYVCFTNRGAQSVDMTKWTLVDEYGWTFEFPTFALESGAFVRVRTGCGDNTEQDLYWCYEGDSAVWNNDEDCVFLKDSQGNEVHQSCY